MKKCLIVSTVSRQFTLFERGNIEVLKNLGYEIHCVANYSDKTDEIESLGVIQHNIDIQRSPFSLKNIKAYKQLKKIIESNKFDFVHCHSPMGGVLARLASKKIRKMNHMKVLYTAHGFHFFKGAPLLNWLLYYPVEKYLSKFTDCIITINKEDYNIAKNKFKAKRVELVNGIGVDKSKFDFEMSEEEKDKLRQEIGVDKEDFLCICVGELNKNKNQIMSIKAIEKLRANNENIKLLLVGKGDCENIYRKYVNENNLNRYVKFLGYRKDVPRLLKLSNVLLSTSQREGLPVNVIEAMFAKLPVVSTECRGSRDLVQNNENGYLIKINDIEQLKDKILEIYFNKFELKQLELDKYSKHNIKDQMKEIYNNILRKKVIMIRSTSIKNDSRIMKESKTLCDSGYEVEILGWDRDGFLNDGIEKIQCDKGCIDIKVYRKQAQYAAGMKSIFKLIGFEMWILKNLMKYRKEIDIIHSCDFDTAIPARLISKKYNIRLVYDIFDYYIDSHYVPNKLKNIVEKAEIRIINDANLTIICTEQRKEQIKKSNPKKCIVIYNTPYIDEEKLKEKIVKSDSSKLKLVYVGILQENRLLKEIGIEISKNKDVELHIGGFGNFETFFEELSNKYDNIFYYGRMQYNDVLNLEKDCDILFATYNPNIQNHKYSAPNKLYEAMALGKPIIVCKGTGIDKLVDEQKLGYSVSYNEEDVIKCIKNYKIEEKQQFESNMKKLYEKMYSWKQMERKLVQEYNALYE